jgi:hypothetical protein
MMGKISDKVLEHLAGKFIAFKTKFDSFGFGTFSDITILAIDGFYLSFASVAADIFGFHRPFIGIFFYLVALVSYQNNARPAI